MKSKNTFLAIFIAISTVVSGFTIYQSLIGPHKGIVQNAGPSYNIELRNTNLDVQAYLLDQKLNALSNKGIRCEIKFIFADSTSYTKSLTPFGNDGFYTSISSIPFCSCRIFFYVSGKTVSAKFENASLIVQKK